MNRRVIVRGSKSVLFPLIYTICGGMLLFQAGGCAGPEPLVPAARAHPAQTPPSADVSRVQAWKDAEMVSSLDYGRSSAVGAGESMQPIYGDNTTLVITKIAYEELRAGMTVAYVNSRGHRVVHILIAKESKGWRAQGLNNAVEDPDRVTKQNLLGVVYASFAAGVEP
jgi:hypothetical protein